MQKGSQAGATGVPDSGKFYHPKRLAVKGSTSAASMVERDRGVSRPSGGGAGGPPPGDGGPTTGGAPPPFPPPRGAPPTSPRGQRLTEGSHLVTRRPAPA